MRPFRRRDRDAQPGDDLPDQHFPFLTVGEAARLRALTREALAEAGIEAEIHGDHLRADDGWTYGLHNLFATCRQTSGGERRWRRAVAQHVTTAVRLRDEPGPADLPSQTLLDHAFVRVCGTGTLPDLGGLDYHRRLGGDLVELLTYDTPEAVAYLTDDEVDRVGAAHLRAAGVEHLLAEPFGDVHWLTGPAGAGFAVLLGDSVYTASRVLALDDVLRRVFGHTETPNGVLLGVPNRHQLVFHLPDDEHVLATIEGMIRFTVDGFTDAPGGVSPHVFWRPPEGGLLEQLTSVEPDATVAVRVQGAFAEIIERLVDPPPPTPS